MPRSTQEPPLDELRATIRDHGLRATPARIAVLRLLRQYNVPLSHAQVVEELGNQAWDRATLYRNLVDMADAGLLRRTDVGDHTWRFEAVNNAHTGDEHPHFVCVDCGSVECLPELRITMRRHDTAPQSVRDKRVEVQLRGVCDNCA